MDEPASGAPPAEAATENRLDSWKEIAAYLKRDVTTVQRWERREGMPIHRHVHEKMGSVYAFRSELDAWTRRRNLPITREDEVIDSSADSRRNRSTIVWAMTAATLLMTLVTIWWVLESREYFWRNPLDSAQFQDITDFGGWIAFLASQPGANPAKEPS